MIQYPESESWVMAFLSAISIDDLTSVFTVGANMCSIHVRHSYHLKSVQNMCIFKRKEQKNRGKSRVWQISEDARKLIQQHFNCYANEMILQLLFAYSWQLSVFNRGGRVEFGAFILDKKNFFFQNYSAYE